MLPYASEWRWGNWEKRETSSYLGTSKWYNSIRMYRQTKHGDWDSVMADIVKDIKAGR
jgi:hypothetical protein